MNKKILLIIFICLLALCLPFLVSSPPSYAGGGNEVGINLGAHWNANAVQMAHNITKDGGWVVLLVTPGSADALTETLSAAKLYNMNVVIRLYNGGQAFTPAQAKSWAATLGCAIINSGTDQKIYIVPWNEPFMDGEHNGIANDRGAIAQAVIDWVHALKQELDASTVSNQANLLSPMFNQFGTSTGTVFENVGEILKPTMDPDFYTHFVGAAMNLYGQYSNFLSQGGSLTGDGIRNGRGYRTDVLCPLLGHPTCDSYPVFAVESGVGIVNQNPFVRYADAQPEIINYYSMDYKDGGAAKVWETDPSFKMFAIFSYDPLTPPNTDWIWGSSVAGYLNGVAQDGSLDTGSAINKATYETWKGGASLEKCANTVCGYVSAGQSDQCNPVNTGIIPGVGVRMSCYITPSPPRSGGSPATFIDPDCPGRLVMPKLNLYPMNPTPSGHFCITFTKNADKVCLASGSGQINYSFTVKVDCPAGTNKDLTGAMITDPTLNNLTYGPFNVPNGTSLTIPRSSDSQAVKDKFKVMISRETINTGTLVGNYAGSVVNLTSSTRVRVEGAGGCRGCQIPNVPYFCQRDPRWASQVCRNTTQTIGQAGCGITSEAMIIQFYKPGVEPNPKDICTRWGILFNNGAANNYLGSYLTNIFSGNCGSGDLSNAYFDEIRARICAGQPVGAYLFRNNSDHFVVITGLDPVNQRVTVNDPWYGCSSGGSVTYSFSEFYSWACPKSLRLWVH